MKSWALFSSSRTRQVTVAKIKKQWADYRSIRRPLSQTLGSNESGAESADVSIDVNVLEAKYRALDLFLDNMLACDTMV